MNEAAGFGSESRIHATTAPNEPASTSISASASSSPTFGRFLSCATAMILSVLRRVGDKVDRATDVRTAGQRHSNQLAQHRRRQFAGPHRHVLDVSVVVAREHTVAGSVTSPSHRIQLPRGQFSSSERHFRVTARRDSCFAIVTASSVASSLSGSKNGHPAGAVDASFDAAASPLWSE